MFRNKKQEKEPINEAVVPVTNSKVVNPENEYHDMICMISHDIKESEFFNDDNLVSRNLDYRIMDQFIPENADSDKVVNVCNQLPMTIDSLMLNTVKTALAEIKYNIIDHIFDLLANYQLLDKIDSAALENEIKEYALSYPAFCTRTLIQNVNTKDKCVAVSVPFVSSIFDMFFHYYEMRNQDTNSYIEAKRVILNEIIPQITYKMADLLYCLLQQHIVE